MRRSARAEIDMKTKKIIGSGKSPEKATQGRFSRRPYGFDMAISLALGSHWAMMAFISSGDALSKVFS
jgi:hypothetical protein